MNQQGAISLDFIFALVLVLSMTLLLGVFSFSLAIAESAQYIAFATSRAYFAAHTNPEVQKTKAEEKFSALIKEKGFSGFIKPGLVSLSVDRIGDAGDIYTRNEDRDILEGVRLKIIFELLNIQIPGLGNTGDSSYEAFVNSFIGREPSSSECMSFMQNRFQSLINKLGNSSVNVQPGSYFAFDDNGC